ncbi:ribosomal RNA small subunit methyltransferase A [Sphingobacteriales bacterium UPWRP_1]|nr:ribosomal RNA small subunit methyltransferase A [Sphingobacteriales bacterium TSM_CSM]PSJ79119.1 ribosomal RNA small subunit methyltransferase A [Sphingobacteriales bacterium UPWRP_1]
MRKLKAFGQHFLRHPPIAGRIAQSLQFPPDADAVHTIVEIGPGQGVLTQFLLALPNTSVFVVEIDHRLPPYLLERFPQLNGHIIEQDVLKVRFEEYIGAQPFWLVGNFPYNISSQILFKALQYRQQVRQVVGMFQKEVAQRIVAGKGNKQYGILSVLLQAYFKTEYLFEVSAGSFDPPPKVQSAVVRLTPSDAYEKTINNHAHFTQTVKQAFNQRRKMLRNALQPLQYHFDQLPPNLPQLRAEQLSIADFIALSNAFIAPD